MDNLRIPEWQGKGILKTSLRPACISARQSARHITSPHTASDSHSLACAANSDTTSPGPLLMCPDVYRLGWVSGCTLFEALSRECDCRPLSLSLGDSNPLCPSLTTRVDDDGLFETRDLMEKIDRNFHYKRSRTISLNPSTLFHIHVPKYSFLIVADQRIYRLSMTLQ